MMLIDIETLRSEKVGGQKIRGQGIPPSRHSVRFSKHELNNILSLYSYQVAKGSWRDYAIDFLKHMAVFSIFRNSSEQPLAAIIKTPGNTASGYIYELFFDKKRLARSGHLEKILQTLQTKL